MLLLKYIQKFVITGLLLVGSVICTKLSGQDFHFTQFFANKLYLGPSFAGATAQSRIITNYRNQWPGLPKGYVTYSLSVDHFISTFNSGVGFLIMRDVAGTGKLGALHVGAYYSYDFDLNRFFHLRPGIGFNFLQRSIDFSKLTFSDMITDDGYQATSEVFSANKTYSFDASTSCILYSKNLTLGFTLDHLLHPNVSLLNSVDEYPMKFSTYGVITMLRKGRLLKPIDETLSLALLLKNFKDYRQLDIGLYWAQSPLTFGIWYRGIPIVNSDRGDSFSALVGLKLPNFSLGYSYDFTISNLISSTGGAHEISLAVEFNKHQKRKKMHAVPCPEF